MRTIYTERLTAPLEWWLFGALIALGVFLAGYGVNTVLGLVMLGVGGALIAAGLVAYGNARVRVSADTLEAGRARIPLAATGAVHELDAEAARRLRSVDADPRAYLMLRGYVRTAVRVEITDPADPTPYAYVSTRHPKQLAAALAAARTHADQVVAQPPHGPASPG
jgi:hypothetical protein